MFAFFNNMYYISFFAPAAVAPLLRIQSDFKFLKWRSERRQRNAWEGICAGEPERAQSSQRRPSGAGAGARSVRK